MCHIQHTMYMYMYMCNNVHVHVYMYVYMYLQHVRVLTRYIQCTYNMCTYQVLLPKEVPLAEHVSISNSGSHCLQV